MNCSRISRYVHNMKGTLSRFDPSYVCIRRSSGRGSQWKVLFPKI